MTYNPNPADKDYGETKNEIVDAFNRWARQLGREMTYSIEANTTRYRTQLTPDERRVSVTWTHPESGEKTISCDRFARANDNIRALWHVIEAIRLNEFRLGPAWGDMMQQAYGLLPAPRQRDPYEVLGVRAGAPQEVILGAYRALANLYHPDKPTGDAERFREVQEAYEQVKR